MYFFFFCNDTATTEIYTLSLHDALPISLVVARPREPRRLSEGARPRRAAGHRHARADAPPARCGRAGRHHLVDRPGRGTRSEEHTSELQSQSNLVCRLLLEKKKTKANSA